MKLQPNRKCGWTEAPLGEKAYEVRELYEPQKEDHLSYIGLEHIEQQTLQLNGIGSSAETVSTKKAFKCGDILFGSLRPYFRKVVRPKFDGVCSTDITVIRVKQDTNQAFFFYFIANQAFIDHASNISSGTRMPRANWKVLEKSKWLFPPFTIQRKIASILSAYDDLIENNNRRIKILEEMAQAIYKEWFVNFRFPGHEKVRMIKSELGMIPEGWEVRNLGDVLSEIESGSRPKGGIDPSERGIPSIGAENIIGLGQYDYIKEKYVSHEFYDGMQRGQAKSKDVLLYKDGAQIGRKSMFRDGFPHETCCINEHVFILRTNERCTQNYLYFWLDQPEMTQKIKNLNANTAQPGINQTGVKGLPILLPTKSLIDAFENIAEPLLAELFNLAKKNNLLRKPRDLLLPKLISGEIDVKGLDINTEMVDTSLQ